MAGRIRIGEILLRAGVIDQHQLNAALGEQRRWGRPLGATLVKMGCLDERSLVRALASQLSLPVASLEGKRISDEVLELVPSGLAEEHMVLPLFVKKADNRTTLYLAMEDPGDLAVLDDLAFRTGLQVKPVMMSPSELAEGIDRYYRAAAGAPAPAASTEVQDPDALDGAALEASSGSTAESGSPEPEPAAAAASPAGTEELVRHFMGGATESDASPAPAPAPVAAQPPPAVEPAAPAPEPVAAAPASTPQPTAVPESPHASFDESALASPPPRESAGDAQAAPALPPVESLASYEAKTRTILHVLTQLLIEKGVISREEFHARVSALSDVDHGALQDID